MSKISWPPRNFKLEDDSEKRSEVFSELLKTYIATLPTSVATGAAIRIQMSRWHRRYQDASSD